MNAAKIAEFETLQRNPYRGPATQMSGGTPLGQTQPSPFTSHSQTGFGFGTQNQSAAPAGSFGQPQLMFGVPVTTPQAGYATRLNSLEIKLCIFCINGITLLLE